MYTETDLQNHLHRQVGWEDEQYSAKILDILDEAFIACVPTHMNRAAFFRMAHKEIDSGLVETYEFDVDNNQHGWMKDRN